MVEKKELSGTINVNTRFDDKGFNNTSQTILISNMDVKITEGFYNGSKSITGELRTPFGSINISLTLKEK